MEWLKKIAPTVASILGSPIAGVAVEAIGNIIGGDKTPEAIKNALQSQTLTADQLAAIKKADAELQVKMKEMGIEVQKLETMDRDSARKMQISTGSNVPAVLGTVITVGFFGILVFLMTGQLKLWDNAGLQMLLGSLGTSWGMVVSFYFGASNSQNSIKEGK